MYKPSVKDKQQSFELCLSYLKTGVVPKELKEDCRIYFADDLLEKVIEFNRTHSSRKRHYIDFDKVLNPETVFECYIVDVLKLFATKHIWLYNVDGWQESVLKYAITQAFKTVNGAGYNAFMDGDTRISIPWETSNHVKQLYNGIETIAREGIEFISFCTKEAVDWRNIKPRIKPLIIELTYKVNEDGCIGRILCTQFAQLQYIKNGLTHLIIEGRCKVFLGLAGSGKSTAACYGLTDKWLGISLCNTVALELYHKNNNVTPLSISAYRCYKRCSGSTAAADICSTPNIMIDETSLWTANELDVLANIINQVKQNNGKLYILGDTHQQHGFLGRGCLLDAITKLANEVDDTCISNHTTLYRQSSMPEHQTRLVRYIETGDMSNFNGITKEIDYDEIAKEVVKDCENSIAVALTNKSVADINKLCIAKLTNTSYNTTQSLLHMNETAFKEWMSNNLWRLDGYKIPLIGAKTQLIAKPPTGCSILDRFRYKILRNEKAWLSNGMVTREITGETTLYDNIFDYFDLGFAITCFRSQGLEWNNTYVVLETPILLNYESLYVAESRCIRRILTYTNEGCRNRILHPIQMLNPFNLDTVQ